MIFLAVNSLTGIYVNQTVGNIQELHSHVKSMPEKGHGHDIFSIWVPMVVWKILHSLGSKYIQFFSLKYSLEQVITLWCKHRQSVHYMLNLVNFYRTFLILIFYFHHTELIHRVRMVMFVILMTFLVCSFFLATVKTIEFL